MTNDPEYTLLVIHFDTRGVSMAEFIDFCQERFGPVTATEIRRTEPITVVAPPPMPADWWKSMPHRAKLRVKQDTAVWKKPNVTKHSDFKAGDTSLELWKDDRNSSDWLCVFKGAALDLWVKTSDVGPLVWP